MRLVFAIVLLVTSACAAHAKDWDQMNGPERRLYVTAYVVQNNLDCKYPPMRIEDQEKELGQRSWLAVSIGMKIYCSQTAAPQQTAIKK